MSIVTRAEFAALCNRDVKFVNVYVSRKKVMPMLEDSSMIDTENPVNILFAKTQKKNDEQKKKESKKPPSAAPSIEKLYKDVVEVVEVEKTKRSRSTKKEIDQADEMLSWDARKKRADALRAESAAEKEKLQVEKMMGQLMPTELVQQIFRINLQSIFKEFEAGCLNIASTYCDIMAGGDRALIGKVTDELRYLLDDTIKRSKEVAGIEIQNAIEEYAETRNRGERK